MKITLEIENPIAEQFTGVCDETCQDVATQKLYRYIKEDVMSKNVNEAVEQARQAKLEQGIPTLDAKIADLEK